MAANAVSAAVGFPLRYKFFSLARNAADVDTYIYIYTHNDTELELAVFVLVGIIGDNYQKVSGDG